MGIRTRLGTLLLGIGLCGWLGCPQPVQASKTSGDISVRIAMRGGETQTREHQGSLSDALEGLNLMEVDALSIFGGRVVKKDWVWLCHKREQLRGLRKFEITKDVESAEDIPALIGIQAKDRGWGHRKRGRIDSTATFFGQQLEILQLAKVENIGELAFFKNRGLKLVSLPDVKQLGHFTFAHCENISLLRAPNLVGTGDKTFYECKKLRTAEFQHLETTGEYAFSHCETLDYVAFNRMDEIEEGVFQGCTKLTTAKFNSVEWIGLWAFGGCERLKRVDFPAATLIVVGAFQGCRELEEAEFPWVENVGNWAFYNCTKLRRIALPSLKRLGLTAFRNCASLDALGLGGRVPELQIPESMRKRKVEDLGEMLCQNCPSDRKIVGYAQKRFTDYTATWEDNVLYLKDKGYVDGKWYGWVITPPPAPEDKGE